MLNAVNHCSKYAERVSASLPFQTNVDQNPAIGSTDPSVQLRIPVSYSPSESLAAIILAFIVTLESATPLLVVVVVLVVAGAVVAVVVVVVVPKESFPTKYSSHLLPASISPV